MDEIHEVAAQKRKRRVKETIPMSKMTPSPAFSLGDAVRVRPGVTDPDFPEMPFGGWAGTIAEVEDGDPRAYLVQLNARTLQSITPIYFKRCERDGLEASEVWMLEEDLEFDVGEPLEIEHPTAIVSEPPSMDNQDDRIRAIFGLTSDDPLPDVDDDSLLTYHQYLATELPFPFEANDSKETGLFSRHTRRVTVISLGEPDHPWIDDMSGILCTARLTPPTVDPSAWGKWFVSMSPRRLLQIMFPRYVPLSALAMPQGHPSGQLFDDYGYWFWNL